MAMTGITKEDIESRVKSANMLLVKHGKSSRYILRRRRGMDNPYYIDILINGEPVDYPVMYGSKAECYDYMRGVVRALEIAYS